MQTTIQKLEKRDVTTKYGQKQKFVVTTSDGKMFDSWVSSWNNSWQVGDTIEFDQSQVTSKEYNGKTYHTLNAPRDGQQRTTQTQVPGEVMNKLDSMDHKLDLLVKMSVKKELEIPVVDEGEEDKVKLEDVPF